MSNNLNVLRHADTCRVKVSGSATSTEAVVTKFIFEEKLDVILNKSVKLSLKWNGQVYEGKGAGMDLESNGPEYSLSRTGR